MAYLNFYREEHKEFETEFNFKVSNKHAKKIIRKLSLHFEFKVNSIRFYGNRQSGLAYPYSIRVSNNPNILLICHECAHLHNKQKTGDWRHSKKLMKTIKKFVHYSRKKGYWLNSILTKNGLETAISQNIPISDKEFSDSMFRLFYRMPNKISSHTDIQYDIINKTQNRKGEIEIKCQN